MFSLKKIFPFVLYILCIFLFIHFIFFGWSYQKMEEATGINKLKDKSILSKKLMSPVKVSWLGHSSMLIEKNKDKVLIDPMFSAWCTIAPRAWKLPIEAQNLGDIKLVIISHAHRDHFDPESLIKLKSIEYLVYPKGMDAWFDVSSLNVKNVCAMSPNEKIIIDSWEVSSFEADHGGSRQHPFESEKHKALGYVLNLSSYKILYTGDTGVGLDANLLREKHHPDMLIVPIGAYLPSWAIGKKHLSPKQASFFAKVLGAKITIPCHFGTYRLAYDDTHEALPIFEREMKARGISWFLAPVWKSSKI